MLLRERLNQLPKQLGYVNKPTDKFIDARLETAVKVLEILRDDLEEENEPLAIQTINNLNEVIDYIPVDCGEVAEIDEGRAKQEEE